MTKIKLLASTAIVSAALVAPASAGEFKPNFYASAGVTHHALDLSAPAPLRFDNDEYGFTLQGGAEFETGHHGILAAVEGGYSDLGDFTITDGVDSADLEFDGWNLGLRLALPVTEDGKARVYARGGMMWWDIEMTGEPSVDGNDWYYGGGVDYEISQNWRVGLDVSAMEYNVEDESFDSLTTTLRITRSLGDLFGGCGGC